MFTYLTLHLCRDDDFTPMIMPLKFIKEAQILIKCLHELKGGVVNKDLSFKAKAKDLTFKTKTKDLTS